MPGYSQYLETSELGEFGLPATVTAGSIRSASQTINAYLGRPEGLVWEPDFVGNPCYMSGVNPRLTIRSPTAIPAGDDIRIPYTGAVLDNNSVGEIVVLDREDIELTEACVIKAVENGFITLYTVQTTHVGPNVKMDFGMSIFEEKELPSDRSIARVSRFPLMKLQSGVGRYGYGRRSQQTAGDFQEFNLLAAVASFGGPPLWIPWQVSNASISIHTGEIWVPAGILLAYFTDVRMWYIAGYSAEDLPFDVKQACANVIGLAKETGLGANIRTRNVRDGTSVGKFENNMIDANTRQILEPYKARRFV